MPEGGLTPTPIEEGAPEVDDGSTPATRAAVSTSVGARYVVFYPMFTIPGDTSTIYYDSNFYSDHTFSPWGQYTGWDVDYAAQVEAERILAANGYTFVGWRTMVYIQMSSEKPRTFSYSINGGQETSHGVSYQTANITLEYFVTLPGESVVFEGKYTYLNALG